jgi:hypothetical protein
MRVNPKVLFTKAELEMTNVMVAKVEKSNRNSTWLNPKCQYNGRSAGKALNLLIKV